MYDIIELNNKSLDELIVIAENLKIPKIKNSAKEDLIYKILDEQAIQGVNSPLPKKHRSRIVKKNPVNAPNNENTQVRENAPIRENTLVSEITSNKNNTPIRERAPRKIGRAHV